MFSSSQGCSLFSKNVLQRSVLFTEYIGLLNSSSSPGMPIIHYTRFPITSPWRGSCQLVADLLRSC